MPSLQFLLLFGSFIDTNSAVDRIVVDSWLELTFASPDDGQQVLSAVVALRDTWNALLNLKLDRQTKIKDVAFDQVAHAIKVLIKRHLLLEHYLSTFTSVGLSLHLLDSAFIISDFCLLISAGQPRGKETVRKIGAIPSE